MIKPIRHFLLHPPEEKLLKYGSLEIVLPKGYHTDNLRSKDHVGKVAFVPEKYKESGIEIGDMVIVSYTTFMDHQKIEHEGDVFYQVIFPEIYGVLKDGEIKSVNHYPFYPEPDKDSKFDYIVGENNTIVRDYSFCIPIKDDKVVTDSGIYLKPIMNGTEAEKMSVAEVVVPSKELENNGVKKGDYVYYGYKKNITKNEILIEDTKYLCMIDPHILLYESK